MGDRRIFHCFFACETSASSRKIEVFAEKEQIEAAHSTWKIFFPAFQGFFYQQEMLNLPWEQMQRAALAIFAAMLVIFFLKTTRILASNATPSHNFCQRLADNAAPAWLRRRARYLIRAAIFASFSPAVFHVAKFAPQQVNRSLPENRIKNPTHAWQAANRKRLIQNCRHPASNPVFRGLCPCMRALRLQELHAKAKRSHAIAKLASFRMM